MKIFLVLVIGVLNFVGISHSSAFWSSGMESVYQLAQSESFTTHSQKAEFLINVGLKPTVTIRPGTNIQAIVSASPEGSTFILKAGIHRLQQIRPKNGQRFLGEPGAILSGAKILTNFIKEGEYWVVNGQFQQGPVKGWCEETRLKTVINTCRFPEDLFIDDIPARQASKIADLRPGRWFFDYEADKIYLALDPTNKKVETSVTRWAFVGSVENIVIKNLIIEKYANPAQEGAIHAVAGEVGPLGKNWLIHNNEIRLNHGFGIRVSTGMRATANHIHHNGQLGLGGTGEQMFFHHNEISYNNTLGYNWLIEGGGAKLVGAKDSIFLKNFVHDNIGPGLWADSDNVNITYEGNRVKNNDGPGIFHERSYSAVIKDNWCGQNGFAFPIWIVGGGIVVASSIDVEISGNTVWYNADGIGVGHASDNGGRFGPYTVENIYVHDNKIVMNGGHTGLSVKSGDPSFFSSRNIRFERNHYILVGGQDKFFHWMNNLRTETEWQSFGQDITGTISRINNWQPAWFIERFGNPQ